MKLIEQSGIFIAHSSYEERAAPKQAGFRWHGGGCWRGCKACAAGLGLKKWWTDEPTKAAQLAEHAEPTLRARLLAAHEKKAAAVAASAASAPTAPIDVPCPTGLAYLPYQIAGIAAMITRPATLLADEMGLGKTVQVLGVINADPDVRTVLVVCPATLRINWQREAEKWLTREFKCHVVEGREPPSADANFVVVNYDKLVGAGGKNLVEALLAREWDLICVDEAHYLKNPDAQRTKVVLGAVAKKGAEGKPGLIAKARRRRLLLTGTPIPNRPIEAQPLLGALDSANFGNFFRFAKRYADAKQELLPTGKWVWDFSGASHLDDLQERLRSTIMVRRIKRDVLKELPQKRRQIVVLAPNGAAGALEEERTAWAHREEAIDALQAEVDLAHASGDAEAYAAAVAHLREAGSVTFTEMSQARHQTALAKVEAVTAHVDNLLEGGVNKLVLFAHHRDVIAKFVEHFGSRCVSITGATPLGERQVAVDRFQSDAVVQVFVGNIQAAGVGITLTAASTVVFAELDWVPANVTQAEDRCHRIGQSEMVLVQHLVFDGSLDARMAQTLVAKQEIADKALDGLAVLELKVLAIPTTKNREPRPAKYPSVSDEIRSAAHRAVQLLAGVCDGALVEDGTGFNKFDTIVGHKLAALSSLTDGQAWLAARMARKYRRQIAEMDPQVFEVLKLGEKAATDAEKKGA